MHAPTGEREALAAVETEVGRGPRVSISTHGAHGVQMKRQGSGEKFRMDSGREERYQERSGEKRGETSEEQSSRQVEASPSGKRVGV